MQTMKHTGGLFRVDDAAANGHVSVWAAPTKENGGYHRWVADCEVELPYAISHDEAVGNANLLGASPWYRILALIAADGGINCGIMPISVPHMHNPAAGDPGWCLDVKDKNWAWKGSVDPFGVPIPPSQQMFEEIKAAIESL